MTEAVQLPTGRVEPACCAAQRPLGLVQVDRGPIGGLTVEVVRQLGDPDGELLDVGAECGELRER